MAFFRVVKSIFKGVGKVLAYIFVTLGLWLPALYSLAFLIIVGSSSKLTMSGPTLAVFCVGLGISTVGGLLLAMKLSARRKANAQSEQSVQPVREKKRKRGKAEKDEEEDEANPRNGYMPQGGYMPPQGYVPPYGYTYPPMQGGYPQQPPQNGYASVPPQGYSQPPQGYAQPPQNAYSGQSYSAHGNGQANADYSDLDRKYFDERTVKTDTSAYSAQPEEYGRTASRADAPAPSSNLGADELWRRLTGSEVPDEQPLVFRTRKDPNVYVYEYSDRYQYWRQTKAGMVLESTEYKKPEELRSMDRRSSRR